MSREQEMLAREIKQLWCVAGVYLCRARTLENERRRHEDIWHAFEKGRATADDLRALKGSADLASAAVRLASLEELLLGDHQRFWRLAYGGQSRTYIHVYLRDAVAHAEPGVGGKAKWRRRQQWLGRQSLKNAVRYVRETQARLQGELRVRYRSVDNITSWLDESAKKWIQWMLTAK